MQKWFLYLPTRVVVVIFCSFCFSIARKKHELYENNVIFVQTSVVIVVFEKIITFNDNGCRKTLFLSHFVGAYTDLVVKNQIKRENRISNEIKCETNKKKW